LINNLSGLLFLYINLPYPDITVSPSAISVLPLDLYICACHLGMQTSAYSLQYFDL